VWSGPAADAAAGRVGADRTKVVNAVFHLQTSAVAAHTAAATLESARAEVLATVAAAQSTGFVVGEDYSVRSLEWNASPAVVVMRKLEAAFHAATIRSATLKIGALDDQVAGSINAAVAGLRELSFDSEGSAVVLFAGFGDGPLPERPSYTSPPVEPPGGWSDDPITRAAQRIAYGHAGTKHLGEWPPGTTRDQFAAEIERIMRAATDPHGGMIAGRTGDGVPAIYDPRTNTLVIRDPNAADAGTAYKPTGGEPYVLRVKMPNGVSSLSPGDLADSPLRPPPEIPKVEPPRTAPLPRGGPLPVVVPPQIVPLPNGGLGNLPTVDVDGIPNPGV